MKTQYMGMKKDKIVFKLFLGLIILFSLVFSGSHPIKAATYTTTEQNLKSLENQLVTHLQSLPEGTTFDTEIDRFLQEKSAPFVAGLSETVDNFPNLNDNYSFDIQTSTFDLEAYIDRNISLNVFRVVRINSNINLIFTDGATFFVDEYSGDMSTCSLEICPQKTKWASRSYTAKNLFGMTLWKGYTSGYFTYNGSTVTPAHDASYIKRGTLSFWEVNNYRQGATKISSTLGEVYVNGSVSWGLTVWGHKFVGQDVYLKVYVQCDNKGNIKKKYIVN